MPSSSIIHFNKLPTALLEQFSLHGYALDDNQSAVHLHAGTMLDQTSTLSEGLISCCKCRLLNIDCKAALRLLHLGNRSFRLPANTATLILCMSIHKYGISLAA